MKIIKYFPKSQEKISKRALSPEEVLQTCLYPEQTLSGRKGRKIAHKREYPKLLRVIYEEEENVYIVITAYYTEPKRYMNHERQL